MPEAAATAFVIAIIVNIAVPVALCYFTARSKGLSPKYAWAGLAHLFGVLYVALKEREIGTSATRKPTAPSQDASEALEALAEAAEDASPPGDSTVPWKAGRPRGDGKAWGRPVRRPFLLNCIMWIAGGSAVLGILFIVLICLAPSGKYLLSGREVTRGYVQRRVLPSLIANAIAAAAIAWAIRANKRWSRPLLLAMLLPGWIASAFVYRDPSMILMSFLAMSLSAALGAWYLYGRDNVVDYFDALDCGVGRGP